MLTQTVPRVPSPPWLQAARWVLDPVRYMSDCRQTHPDLFATRISGRHGDPVIFVQEPRILQYLFSHDRRELFAPGDGIGVLEPLIGQASVVMLEGEPHVRRRRLLLPPFHGERLHVYADLIGEIAVEELSLQRPGVPFRAHRLTQQISLQVIMRSVFGLDRGPRYDEIRRLLTEVFDTFASPLWSAFLFYRGLQVNWGPWRAFVRRRNRLDELLYAEISDRAADSAVCRSDVLSLLMTARDEQGAALTPRELRNELMTLLLAGLETTSTVMAWALYWIHRHPEVRRQILEELDQLPTGTPRSEWARLPYLTAVCQEVLRIHPPVPFTFARIPHDDLEIEGWRFPRGSRIAGCIYLLHQRADLYPQPEQFRPERFRERKFALCEFMPFGAGARRCIGEALAMLEIKVALATLLRTHEFALVGARPETPVRRGVILTPRRGVPLRIVGPRTPGGAGPTSEQAAAPC
jgi:unspecific monooxygenase